MLPSWPSFLTPSPCACYTDSCKRMYACACRQCAQVNESRYFRISRTFSRSCTKLSMHAVQFRFGRDARLRGESRGLLAYKGRFQRTSRWFWINRWKLASFFLMRARTMTVRDLAFEFIFASFSSCTPLIFGLFIFLEIRMMYAWKFLRHSDRYTVIIEQVNKQLVRDSV